VLKEKYFQPGNSYFLKGFRKALTENAAV